MIGSEIYWDTCIFIALLTDEDRDPNETKGIKKLNDMCEAGQIKIFTSVLTLTEIRQSSIREDKWKTFNESLKSEKIELLNVDRRIAEKAQTIRTYYLNRNEKIGTPDVIHIATAIHFNCKTMYTFDGKNREGKNIGLLPLSGTIAGKYYLEIKNPSEVVSK